MGKHKKPMTEEHKAKLSAKLKGKKLSEETKTKMREAWTPERRAKHSAFMSERDAAGFCVARKGYVVSEETRRKMSLAHIGKPKSEETRRKMSESHKKSARSKSNLQSLKLKKVIRRIKSRPLDEE